MKTRLVSVSGTAVRHIAYSTMLVCAVTVGTSYVNRGTEVFQMTLVTVTA
jgi:hypothetical protein